MADRRKPYTPRAIFVSASTDDGATWSQAVNVSNTETQTDLTAWYDRVGDGSGLAHYYGDADKPEVFASGNNVVIAWNDTHK